MVLHIQVRNYEKQHSSASFLLGLKICKIDVFSKSLHTLELAKPGLPYMVRIEDYFFCSSSRHCFKSHKTWMNISPSSTLGGLLYANCLFILSSPSEWRCSIIDFFGLEIFKMKSKWPPLLNQAVSYFWEKI